MGGRVVCCVLIFCAPALPLSLHRQPSGVKQLHARAASPLRRAALVVASSSLSLRRFESDEGGGGGTGVDAWIPTSLVTTAARDPYKVALRVLPMLLVHVAWASLIVAVRHCVRFSKPWAVSPLLHTLLGGVLGLLLAFRTNQAWNRYWSAAQAWSDVHRGCHSLARLASQLSVALDPIVYASMMRRFRGAGPRERRETDEEGSIRRREQIGEQTRASTTSPHLGEWSLALSRLRHLVALPVALKQRVRRAPNPREYFEAPR